MCVCVYDLFFTVSGVNFNLLKKQLQKLQMACRNVYSICYLTTPTELNILLNKFFHHNCLCVTAP